MPQSLLLVEPHDDTRELYAAYFELEAVTVFTAASAEGAIAQARGCDVVITELQLPGSLSGCGLIRRLRADPTTRHIPVVVLSASSQPRHVRDAWKAGCDLFVTKPCLPEDLQAAVRQVIRRSPDKVAPVAGLSRLRTKHRRGA